VELEAGAGRGSPGVGGKMRGISGGRREGPTLRAMAVAGSLVVAGSLIVAGVIAGLGVGCNSSGVTTTVTTAAAGVARTTTSGTPTTQPGPSTTEPDWSTTPSSGHGPDTTASSTPGSTWTGVTAPADRPLFPVHVGGKWGFIDQTGAWVIEPRFEQESPPIFVDGLATIETTGPLGDPLCGCIDKTGA
jgi:WG containing repeat